MIGMASGLVIGVLGGLIGLGGGEFRLPVLTALLRYSIRAAVPINLVISFITLVASLFIRASVLPLSSVSPHIIEVLALGLGGMIGARWSARFLTQIADHHLEYAVAALLGAIGLLLIIEALLPADPVALMPRVTIWLALSGVVLGILTGIVAALLGVAGGELLIPTLMLVYGADIRTAGTASLLISLVTVASGLWRYHRLEALPDRVALHGTAIPMSIGSIVGAVAGGLLLGIVSVVALKVVLGLVLIAAASKPVWPWAHRAPH
jgi:uncharacterized membrane protein YfcA